MRQASRARAREERKKERVVQEAFDRFMDHTVERLTVLGVDEPVAVDAVFNTVTHLAEENVLPPFPEGVVSYQEMGQWLLAAADFNLAEFMAEAVEG